MNAKDLRDKTVDELRDQLANLKKESFNLRFQQATGQLENTAGIKAARRLAKDTGSTPPPKHIMNAPTKLMAEQGYGDGYAYDHDAEDGFSGQNYFPDGMKRPVLYAPVERGYERDLKKRVDYFAGLRSKRSKN